LAEAEIELAWCAAEEEKCQKGQIPRFKSKFLAIRIVIYMKGFGYIEKMGLIRQEKCRWATKTRGFLREIAIKEG